MKDSPGIGDKFRQYRFEVSHLTVLLVVLMAFQVFVAFIHKSSVERVLERTQVWYQQDAAERLANLTAISLELLLEAKRQNRNLSELEIRKTVQDFNIIFSQHTLQQNVQDICVLLNRNGRLVRIDNGQSLFSAMYREHEPAGETPVLPGEEGALFRTVAAKLESEEQTQTIVEGGESFHVFVPFVPRGEFVGALYLNSSLDLSSISNAMIANYDETVLTFSSLILFGLLAMYYISSYTLKQRDKALTQLFEEQKQHLADQINHQKEAYFTRRIYHTHHKAEKIMGYIKEDLGNLTASSLGEVKQRVNKYASFIARAIYDMKWYDPPVQSVRGPLFTAQVNDIIRFLVDHVFLRLSRYNASIRFELDLDPSVPAVEVNEFVIWEILEPLIQNGIDHSGTDKVLISLSSSYHPTGKVTRVVIRDSGKGIPAELLQVAPDGRQMLFVEGVTQGLGDKEHSGYGCFIAYQIATARCGWTIAAHNHERGGAEIVITIPHA